jgi:hypothetical protein
MLGDIHNIAVAVHDAPHVFKVHALKNSLGQKVVIGE